jgi:hypothetical protein
MGMDISIYGVSDKNLKSNNIEYKQYEYISIYEFDDWYEITHNADAFYPDDGSDIITHFNTYVYSKDNLLKELSKSKHKDWGKSIKECISKIEFDWIALQLI